MENLTLESFKEKIFDFEKNEEWDFKGTKPTIIDFYADWCGPCKTLSPILEELSKEHPEIDIFKVNTEDVPELAQVFQIKSIPSLLMIPMGEEPQMSTGAIPKDHLETAIKEVLKV
jgi:thioredoxin